MKILAKNNHTAWALGVLVLFTLALVPVDTFAQPKKSASVVQKKVQQTPESVLIASEMETDRVKAVEKYYVFTDTLDKKLDTLKVDAEQFQMIVESGLNRLPDPPQRVVILRKFYLVKNVVAIWYRAIYLPGYGGSRDDMAFLVKTDQGWKIDPSYSWWFARGECLYRWYNKTCVESQKMFRGENGDGKKQIGKRVRDYHDALVKALAIEAENKAKAADAEDEEEDAPQGAKRGG